MSIWASSFWTLASGTSVADRIEREELRAVLPPEIDSIGVVSVGLDVGLLYRGCKVFT